MRLIDADAMLKRNKNSIYDTTDLEEMLYYEPTAYDVDKVVSELEKENERLKTLKNNCIALCDHEVIGIENKAYDYAIKIVRNGGKDDYIPNNNNNDFSINTNNQSDAKSN